MERMIQMITRKQSIWAAVLLMLIGLHATAQDSGNALHFNSGDDYVQLPANIFSGLGDFTIEGWVNADEFESGHVFNFGNTVGEYVSFQVYANTTGSNSTAKFLVVDGGVEYIVNCDRRNTSNIWQHFAITLDKVAGIASVYLDGELAGSGSVPISFNDLAPTANNYFGRSQNGAETFFYGVLDEFRVWSGVRTQQQIKDNMFNELVGNEAGLFLYYDFNVGTGNGTNTSETTLYDITANGNNGTLFNFDLNTGRYSNWIVSNAYDLISWHPFTDGFVTDQVGGNGGTFIDPVVQTDDRFGILGKAILFSGGHIETDLVLTDNQPFSVSAWVNWDGSLGLQNVVSWFDGSLSGRTMLSVNGDNGGEIRFGDAWPATGIFVNPNQWTHIIATYDGKSTAKIYLWGYENASNTGIAAGSYNFKQTTPGFYIGALEPGAEVFQGKIDDVRVWDTYLFDDNVPIQGSLTFRSYAESEGSIRLFFEGLLGVSTFRLERYNENDSTRIYLADLNGWETTFWEDGLEPNTDYTYELYALDAAGNETLYTRVVSTYSAPYTTKFGDFGESWTNGDNFNSGRSIASDSLGNIYYFGDFTNDINIGSESLTGTTDIPTGFLLKQDENLNNLWSRSIHASDFFDAWNVATSPSNDVYVTGYFNGDINFAGETISNSVGTGGMYLLKFDSDGNEIWARSLDATATAYGLNLTADQDGFIYVGGEVHGDFTFAGETKSGYGPLLLKYNSDGGEIWSFSSVGDDATPGWIDDVGYDGTNLYIAGSHFGNTTFNFGVESISSTAGADLFIMKLDTDANIAWTRTAGGDAGEYNRGMAFADNGDVFITGWYYSSEFTIAGTSIFNQGSYDAYLARIQGDGTLAWINTIGTAFGDSGYGIETDGTNVFQTGRTSMLNGNIGGIEVKNGGMYVAMYDEFGTAQWVTVVEGSAYGTGLTYVNDALYAVGNYRYSFNIAGQAWGNFNHQSTNMLYGKITNFSADTGAPVVTLNNVPTYVRRDSDYFVDLIIEDISAIADVTYYFTGINDVVDSYDLSFYNGFSTSDITTAGTYNFQLFANSITDPLGVQYIISVTDVDGNTGWSDVGRSYIESLNEDNFIFSAQPIANRDSPQESDFRMFSVNTEGLTVFDVFDTGPSSLNPQEMGVYHYNNGSLSELGDNTTLEVGKGYWLIYTTNVGLDASFFGNRAQINNENPFVMQLNSGWNQIGNPFPFEITWGDILDFNVLAGNIPSNHGISQFFVYNGAWDDEGFFTMSPTDGFFVRSNEPYTLAFPTTGIQNALLSTARRGEKLDEDEWKLNIDLENERTAYRVAAVGMKPEALDAYDRFDIEPLPYMNDYIEFNTTTEDGKVVSQSYVPTSDGYIWDFEATTSYERMTNKLTWDNSSFGDNDRQLWLYDVAGDRVVNMREQSEYAFTLDQKRPFKVIFGDMDFVNEHLVSDHVAIGKAYPNPFTQTITIPLTLSESPGGYAVKADVFNSMGQNVKTLVNDSMSQGFYSITWDGTNNGGQELSEGIYYYQVKVESTTGTQTFKGKIINMK